MAGRVQFDTSGDSTTSSQKAFGIVYLVRNQVNGKCYIGQTVKSLAHRFKRHISDAKAGSKYVIHNAIRKYGEDAFLATILLHAEDRTILDAYERAAIMQYQSVREEYGYNITSEGGGVSGYKRTPEQIAKLSASLRGRQVWNKGLKADAATRKKLSDAHHGKSNGPHSDATKRKMSATAKCRQNKPLSEEHRKRISTSLTGIQRGPMKNETKLKLSSAATAQWERTRSTKWPDV